jgi:hypothetical protein
MAGSMLSKRSVFLVAIGAASSAAVFAISNVLASSSELPRPGVIPITGTLTSRLHLDLGLRGPSAGDLDISRDLLYNRRVTSKPIGHSEMVCTATGTRSHDCSGTFFLPKGRIVVAGPMSFPEFYEMAVVGGTGLYDNVRGTLTVTELGGRPPRFLIFFRLIV